MTKKPLYIVFARTGEYADIQRYVVTAYTDKLRAIQHVLNANKRAKEWQETRKTMEDPYADPPQGFSEFDPHLTMDFNGTSYYIDETELLED